jgi:hypothetical protein
MRIPFQYSVLATAAVLVGCGGGSGSGATSSAIVRSSVSYYTPSSVNHFVPMTGSGINAPVADVFTKDLNNDAVEEVVVGGRKTQPSTSANWRNFNMQVFGWNTGTFSNETNTWFSGTDNEIVGTEPSIKFGDFNGDGNMDMFVAPSTDMTAVYGDALVYMNTGSNSFVRQTLPVPVQTWSHDSAVYDLNNDGYMDIVATDYGANMNVHFGQADGTFDTYIGNGVQNFASGISVADYLGDGSATFIMTDANSGETSDTVLYTWSTTGGSLALTKIATLPASRFLQSSYDDARATAGWAPHGIRNFSMDFNHDGLMDVVVIDNLSGNGINMSEMQFLQNNGAGSFTDVTDDVLVNYSTDTQASYNPVIMDVNNDGLDDIFLSASDHIQFENHNSTRVLIQTTEGKFVESYSDVFTDFYTQVYSMTANSLDWGQPIMIVQGPDSEKYLFTTVLFNNSGNTEAVTYLAKIGSTGTIPAQSIADAIQNVWPYLSDTSVNTVLAQTAPLALDGVQVVDLSSAMQPVGHLTVNRIEITGSLNISGMNPTAFSDVAALDQVGRNYRVDISSMTNDITPDVNVYTDTAEKGVAAVGTNQGYRLDADSSVIADTHWRFGISVAQQSQNPWLNFNGMFGEINHAQSVEININRKYTNGIWHRTGVMQTQTNFDAGLVTRVDDLWSAYGVLGYRTQGLNIYGGIKPTLFAGSVGVRLPTSVDNRGNLQYTNLDIKVRNQMLGVFGFDLSFALDQVEILQWNMQAQIDSAGNKRGNLSVELPW